jgi:tripartite-type tricarboxylate transporter receptor subunit TctC
MIKKITLISTLVLSSVCADALAQAYPNRPVRLVVGFTPGGAADYVGRNVGDALGKALGQPVIVDNKPGAGSSIAAEYVAKATPDGYTILIASPSSISVNPALNPRLSPNVNSLVPISKVTNSPLVIAVNPGIGVNSVRDLIAAAKKAPGKIDYASSGNGSAPHLGAVLFSQNAGVELMHIPYKGGSPGVQSVVAGETQVTFGTPPSVLPFIKAGRLRGLAVSTPDRSPLVPDLPGMTEAGLPAYKIGFWYGFFAPAGTPPEIVKKLYDATMVAMKRPEMKAALAREGTEVTVSSSPADFAAFLKEDSKFWAKLAKDSGATID